MEKKFLSQVLDQDSFFHGTLNVVVSPCGSGKTHAAINVVAKMASKPYKALYLIDTRNGCQRVAKEKGMTLPCFFYDDDIIKGGVLTEFDKTKVVVTTYAKFGVWCSHYPNYADNFEVIVCDEVHNLVQFSTFNSDWNYTAIARDCICDAVIRGKTLFVGITATPEFLNSFYSSKSHMYCPQYTVPIDTSELNHYTEENTVHYASINQLLANLSPGLRGILYVQRVTQMMEYEKLAQDCGHNPICLWSLSYKVPMNSEQLRVLKYLIENEKMPPEYNLLIINASCETAINIRPKPEIDYFIVHNINKTHIVQSRGRYRGDLKTLYLLDKDNGIVIVPNEYLGQRLFKEGKTDLINSIYIKNDKGRLIPWDKLSKLIKDSGYTITEGKTNDRPYIVIDKKNIKC